MDQSRIRCELTDHCCKAVVKSQWEERLLEDIWFSRGGTSSATTASATVYVSAGETQFQGSGRSSCLIHINAVAECKNK